MDSVLLVVVKPAKLDKNSQKHWEALLQDIAENVPKVPKVEVLGETVFLLPLDSGTQTLQLFLSVVQKHPFEHRLLFIKDKNDWIVTKAPTKIGPFRMETF